MKSFCIVLCYGISFTLVVFFKQKNWLITWCKGIITCWLLVILHFPPFTLTICIGILFLISEVLIFLRLIFTGQFLLGWIINFIKLPSILTSCRLKASSFRLKLGLITFLDYIGSVTYYCWRVTRMFIQSLWTLRQIVALD